MILSISFTATEEHDSHTELIKSFLAKTDARICEEGSGMGFGKRDMEFFIPNDLNLDHQFFKDLDALDIPDLESSYYEDDDEDDEY